MRFQTRSLRYALCGFIMLALTPWTAIAARHTPGQASLSLDTTECPTSFEHPVCEARTSWTLETSSDTGPLSNPDGAPYSFTVTVTEGPTTDFLVGSGQVVVTNSGVLSGQLSSIAVLLEKAQSGGGGNAPGPSGQNWQVVASAIATESADCAALGVARTCYGDVVADGASRLVLRDPMNNDVIALMDVLPVPSSTCANAVVINFDYEFDLSALGLTTPGNPDNPDDDLRIDLIATFGSAGWRGRSGASCTLDANCNGMIDVDDPSTPDVDESEELNIRSIQQRYRFDLPECDPRCDEVTLAVEGASAADPSCVSVTNDQSPVSLPIAVQGEGAITETVISGTVTCNSSSCGTSVTATATLEGDGCNGSIDDMHASASFDVVCEVPEIPIAAGDFCSASYNVWGSATGFSLLKQSLDANFNALFPDGLIIGDPDGPGDGDMLYSLKLTSPQAIVDYLPLPFPPGGLTPGVLTADLVDPLVDSSRLLGWTLVGATLNVAFDNAGLRTCSTSANCAPGPYPPGTLGQLRLSDSFAIYSSLLPGMTLNEVIELANVAISGGGTPPGLDAFDLFAALGLAGGVNFQLCSINLGYLCCPPPGATAAQGDCYATTGNFAAMPGHLFTVDASSGEAALVGPTHISGDGFPPGAGSSAVPALAIDSQGVMYATNVDPSASLFRLDAATGRWTRRVEIGLYYPDGLAFDLDDVLYVVDSVTQLWRIDDVTSGAKTLVGQVFEPGYGNPAIRGIDFDPTTGILWGGATQPSDAIYTIDVNTAVATRVGFTGFGGATPALCFDDAGNLLAAKGGGQTPNRLISIDKATGAGTHVAFIEYNGSSLRAVAGMGRRNATSLLPGGPPQLLASQGTGSHAAGSAGIPQRTALVGNDPNPFNPATQIRFELASATTVDLRIYDASGRLVRALVTGTVPAGSHAVTWDGRDAAGRTMVSGVYFYRLDAGEFSATRRMLLLK